MNLKEFKLVKNKQRPDFCYAYEKYIDNKDRKLSIFTMDGGKSFLASIVKKNNLGKLVITEFSEKCDTIDIALDKLNLYVGK